MSLDSLNNQIGIPIPGQTVDPIQVGLPTGTTTTSETSTTNTLPVGTNTTAGNNVSAASLLQSDFSQISGIVSSGLAGGIGTAANMKNLTLIGKSLKGTEIPVGQDETITMKASVGSKLQGLGQSAKEIGGGTLQGAKYGAIIGGAISAITNGYQVLTGQKSSAQAVGSFAADTVSTTLSGAGGGLAGGVTALSLSALGVGGFPLTLAAAGIGLTAAVGSYFLVQKTGLYDAIKEKVGQMLGKSA